MVVIVTGSNGQLGQALQLVAIKSPELDFIFCSSHDLDITQKTDCEAIFLKYKPQYCINAAAYTAVDKAETEPDKAYAINAIGAKNLAEVCRQWDVVLLHVSTDFVFDGSKSTPYTEEDIPNPTGVYGQTKLDGERFIQQEWPHHFIIRTSWVYSPFGNNFMKTMLRLASERTSLSVVSDQKGTPTHAVDLAAVLIQLIDTTQREKGSEITTFGIYNFSNEGQCSWYDFAKAIFAKAEIAIDLQPIPTSSYPTPAKRPSYSVLDKSKIKETFKITILNWEERLKKGL